MAVLVVVMRSMPMIVAVMIVAMMMVMIMASMVVVMMAESRQMKVIHLARETAQQQPETKTDDQQTAAKLQDRLQTLLPGSAQAAGKEQT